MNRRLVEAEGDLLDRILDLTHPIWHDGLTRAAYAQWNRAQVRIPWGRQRLRRVALVTADGDLLASAKEYRFEARLDGQHVTLCGFGALFTPPDRRGRGHARALLTEMLARAREAGAVAACLFSEIGSDFYARMGFRPVPFEEVTVSTAPSRGAPAMLVRSGSASDLPALAALHDVRSSGARLALRREPAYLEFALAKRRLFSGLSPLADQRGTGFFVAEEGASAVAYVVLSTSPAGWTLEEAGDRDPSGARLGAILQVLLAREPSLAPPRIRAWWPHGFPVAPQLRLTERGTARDLFMLKPLTGSGLPARGEDIFYWRCDQF